MEQNVIEKLVVPEVPKVIPNQEMYVYVPIATDINKGIASYDSVTLLVSNGVVSVKTSFVSGLIDERIVQELGQNIDKVISQKVVTDLIQNVASKEEASQIATDIATEISRTIATEIAKTVSEQTVEEYVESSVTNKLNQVYIRLDYIDGKLDTIETSVNEKLATVETSIDKKLDKVEGTSEHKRVYVIDEDGTQNTSFVSSETLPSSVVVRDSDGQIKVPAPNNDTDSTNKDYTDSTFASLLEFSMDNSTFVITATLKNLKGETLGYSQTIDLPLESVVVNASYNSSEKKIVLTLQNGNVINVPVSDLISGLTSTSDFNSLKSKSLLKPDTAPTSKSIVIVDTNNNQQLLTLGTGLSISGTVISSKDTKPTSVENEMSDDGYLTTKITLNDGSELQSNVSIVQNYFLSTNYDLGLSETWVSEGAITQFAEEVYQALSEAEKRDGLVVIYSAPSVPSTYFNCRTVIISRQHAMYPDLGALAPYNDISFIIGTKLCVLQWSFVPDTGEFTPTFSTLEHNSFTVTENDDGTVDITID